VLLVHLYWTSFVFASSIANPGSLSAVSEVVHGFIISGSTREWRSPGRTVKMQSLPSSSSGSTAMQYSAVL
jgi:hypothetical protein